MTKDLKIEPKIGEIITVKGIKYITQSGTNCPECDLRNIECWNIVCNLGSRKDSKAVIFKKVENTMEVKIQIPDNCELIKDGDTYVVKEKKQGPPRSWEEFCKRYPKQIGESFITSSSDIHVYNGVNIRNERGDKNICSSKEEAEAFLALMQLRQLRKAWVGDWECPKYGGFSNIGWDSIDNKLTVYCCCVSTNRVMSFPTEEMAKEFLKCFKDLLEKAKVLL